MGKLTTPDQKQKKRARGDRAGTCFQPYIAANIIRRRMRRKSRLSRLVAPGIAGAVDALLIALARDAKEVAGGEHKQIDVVHIGKCIVDPTRPYCGMLPPIANLHVLVETSSEPARALKKPKKTVTSSA